MTSTRSHWTRPVLLCLAGIVAAAGVGHASTSTGSLSVSAQVGAAGTCLVGNSSLNFGAFDPATGAATNSTGSINVNCSSGVIYSIDLNNGQHFTGDGWRHMQSGAGMLQYGLYQDAGHTVPWGTALGGSGFMPSPGTQTVPIYGLIPPQATPPDGTYTDVVTIIVTF